MALVGVEAPEEVHGVLASSGGGGLEDREVEAGLLEEVENALLETYHDAARRDAVDEEVGVDVDFAGDELVEDFLGEGALCVELWETGDGGGVECNAEEMCHEFGVFCFDAEGDGLCDVAHAEEEELDC